MVNPRVRGRKEVLTDPERLERDRAIKKEGRTVASGSQNKAADKTIANIAAERARKEASLKETEEIRGGRGEELETFEDFQDRRVEELSDIQKEQLREYYRNQGFGEEDIDMILSGEAYTGQASSAEGLVTDLALLGAGGPGIARGAKSIFTKIAIRNAEKKAGAATVSKTKTLLSKNWKLLVGLLAVGGFGVKEIVDVPTDRIDSMESQAGKIGENSAELINLAKGGRPEEAMRLAAESYDLLNHFDSETVRLSKLSSKSKLNPEYIDNARYEYWKSMQEVIATMDEIQRVAASPKEQDLLNYEEIASGL